MLKRSECTSTCTRCKIGFVNFDCPGVSIGVADILLRAQVSQEINNRLMDQLSTFNDQTPLIDLLAPYVRSHTQQGRRVRALDIGGKGRQLTTALAALLATSTEQLLNIAA